MSNAININEFILDLEKLAEEFKQTKLTFRTNLDEFILYWEREAEELKHKELTEDSSKKILSDFMTKKLFLLGSPSSNYRWDDNSKLDLVESKLRASLVIATCIYSSNHKTILERIVDSIGKIRVFVNIGLIIMLIFWRK